MLEQLELLLDLSRIDSELQDLGREHEALPSRIAELEDERARLKSEVADKAARFDELSKDRQRLERDLDDLGARLSDLESKRLAIKTNEEYAALSHEIDFTRADISKKEDAILDLLEQAEETKTELDEATRGSEEAERSIDERVARLSEELRSLDDAVAVKRDERLRVAMRVNRATLASYERILESKGDSAVARISEGACSGCYVQLPPQTVIEIRRADTLIECQSCGRILVWVREREDG